MVMVRFGVGFRVRVGFGHTNVNVVVHVKMRLRCHLMEEHSGLKKKRNNAWCTGKESAC